ncbi:hypothetical protein NON08_13750 [Cetobacterium somerae]|uniref:hypothetical protein n=1 Tax=Cetobacterium sp. NK01 TaxID=2993530 RepID=UPI0021169FAE|nr:hypothetical protein [Cetobacterium sp. NK01]MCQ8213566.1 hypothetical protein [Cetobacterium sp. NK01]
MNFKILISTLTLISLLGCTNLNNKNINKNAVIKTPTIMMNQKLTLESNNNKYIGELNTDNNWENAIFITPDNKQYNLTRAISADGIKLNNGSLVIHFKGDYGILEKNSIITKFKIK